MNIFLIYWSGTGNTERMAECIAEGARESGATVTVKSVEQASVEDVTSADLAILGCPSMGDEVLEEGDFEPFVESLMDKVTDKKLALFGSYDWGDGQWMRDWTTRMEDAGAFLATDSLIINNTPDDEGETQCKEWGAALAK